MEWNFLLGYKHIPSSRLTFSKTHAYNGQKQKTKYELLKKLLWHSGYINHF